VGRLAFLKNIFKEIERNDSLHEPGGGWRTGRWWRGTFASRGKTEAGVEGRKKQCQKKVKKEGKGGNLEAQVKEVKNEEKRLEQAGFHLQDDRYLTRRNGFCMLRQTEVMRKKKKRPRAAGKKEGEKWGNC